MKSVVFLRRNIPPETQEKVLLRRKIIFRCLTNKLTLILTLNGPHKFIMMRKCYSVNRSSIDESNESVPRNWIVFRHEIVAKLTSAAEFSGSEYLGKYEKL